MSRKTTIRWACDYCGEQGTRNTDLTVDSIQCRRCD